MTVLAVATVTAGGRGFVSAHVPLAREIGADLAGLVEHPDALVSVARDQLPRLADPGYADALERVVPGAGRVLGVRTPLLGAVARPIRGAVKVVSAERLARLVRALAAAPELEIRTLAVTLLRRLLDGDSVAAWGLVRESASRARCWVDVDGLAGVLAVGIVRDPGRWTELHAFVASASEWERRLVGSTIATIPHRVPPAHRARLAPAPALAFVEGLMGDDSPNVQKALSWALREWARVDPAGTAGLIASEADVAAATADGYRAWVIRDALIALPSEDALRTRGRLAGIRRRHGSPPTSRPTRPAQPLTALRDGPLHAVLASRTRRRAAQFVESERSRPA